MRVRYARLLSIILCTISYFYKIIWLVESPKKLSLKNSPKFVQSNCPSTMILPRIVKRSNLYRNNIHVCVRLSNDRDLSRFTTSWSVPHHNHLQWRKRFFLMHFCVYCNVVKSEVFLNLYETQPYLFSMAVLTTSTQHSTAVGKTEKREVFKIRECCVNLKISTNRIKHLNEWSDRTCELNIAMQSPEWYLHIRRTVDWPSWPEARIDVFPLKVRAET